MAKSTMTRIAFGWLRRFNGVKIREANRKLALQRKGSNGVGNVNKNEKI